MRNLRRIFLLLAIGLAAQAQSWDTSGNGMLSGTYYFRQVIYVVGDQYGDLGEAVSLYGNISFDGNGSYSITTTSNAVEVDCSSSGCGAGNFTGTGTYSISASGYGFISSPVVTGDYIYGLVSEQGIFVGSSTDNTYGYNDFFVAAPLASPLPTAASFSGTYAFANLDLTQNLFYTLEGGEGSLYNLGMMFSLNADGACHLTNVVVTGYVGTTTAPYTQTSSSLSTCTFSNGAAVVTFPTNSNGTLMSGQKYLYFSKDGNFVFGGSPYSGTTPFDMIVGVKVSSGTPNFSGLYYQAGIDDVGGDLDTYYGALSAGSGNILGHQRVEDVNYTPATTDSTYTDSYTLTSGSTYSTSSAHYTVGAGGAIRIGAGIGPYLGLSVALQAPTVTGTGVFLNPQGIVNAASWAPFTAGISPGELLTLFNGSNLAANTVVSGIPFQTSLGNVQVSIGGLPAPIYYVSPTQIAAIVPYAVAPGTIADIQVTNNGVLSNAVPVYVNETSPGVFTQNANGLGYGAALHADYSIVTATSPAAIGETVAVYLTGLGTVNPPIADGALGPTSTLSWTTNTVTAYIGSATTAPVQATVAYAGLAPGLSGLYQIDITIPPGLTAGDNYLYIIGPDASNSQSLIPIATSSGSTSAVPAAAAAPALQTHAPGRLKVNPKTKRPPSLRSGIGGGRVKQ
jgi:uncharacterized protein (TIGR03437 family)